MLYLGMLALAVGLVCLSPLSEPVLDRDALPPPRLRASPDSPRQRVVFRQR
jgi:hypothetical protein